MGTTPEILWRNLRRKRITRIITDGAIFKSHAMENLKTSVLLSYDESNQQSKLNENSEEF
jgi:hypothetical protein